MNTRKGMGKGLGTGYKNLAPMDAHIHSLSAKGVVTFFPTPKKIFAHCPNCSQSYNVLEGSACPKCNKTLDAKGECCHCHRKFTEEDYKKASEGVVGDECLVGDFDNICYPCQFKHGTAKAKRLSGLSAKGGKSLGYVNMTRCDNCGNVRLCKRLQGLESNSGTDYWCRTCAKNTLGMDAKGDMP